MPDQPYKEYPFIFASKGIQARPADDTLDPAAYANLDNIEELAENAFGQRLGSTLITKRIIGGITLSTSLPGPVYSLQKLSGLNGNAWRYAGSGTGLYRLNGAGIGQYAQISNTMSGNPWMGAAFKPDLSSTPTMFIADSNGMLKDNGTYPAPQQSGIFQPEFPVQAQAQEPDLVTLDNFTGTVADYTLGGVIAPSLATYVATTLTSAVAAAGITTVTVADPEVIQLFQLLTIDVGPGQETVLVLQVTATGFVANFTKPHAAGAAVTARALSVTVPASTTATISKAFVGTPISAWPTTLQQADYIGIQLQVSDPTQVQSITIKFDCGDGTFNTDYFYKVIAQGPLQSLLNNVNAPTTAAADAILSSAIGVYSNNAGGVAALNSGLNSWTPFLFQLSDFAGSGKADFNGPVFNWQNVNGYQITIVTNDQTSVVVTLESLILFGGAGPDSFAGVAYDYMFTFYNANDGTESNPSMPMTNINPPNNTNWVLPRRQPVLLSLNLLTIGPGGATKQDLQITSVRIYRRGGTLGDTYRRVDEIVVNIASAAIIKYLDTTTDADLAAADIISFTNDVPVTSGLPNPVNTALTLPIGGTNQITNVFPASMQSISIRQQVTLGSPTSIQNNFETVIVLEVFANFFTAFVQNTHAAGEQVQSTAAIGLPVTIIAIAYGQGWYAGDKNNPHLLYWSEKSNPQAVGSASNIEVGSPDDPITAIVPFKGNLYVSTRKFWWAIAPGSNQNGSPTVYPTAAKHGCMAPFGVVATEEAIYYQAIDGLRAFAGGASSYLTQDIEFIFQGVGTTPIVQADPNQFSQTQMQYWNNMIFSSYIGLDGKRHRVILHTVYKRWRNDDADAVSLLLEADTNSLVYGDSNGAIHLDRQNVGYDEQPATAPQVGIIQAPISIALQTGFQNQGMPDIQKNYNELTLDVNTAGQNLVASLVFDDGEFSVVLGNFTNAQRGKINFNLNSGEGYSYYKVQLVITGSVAQRVYLYQCSIKALPLAKTRKSFDTYNLNCGGPDSKYAKDIYIQYSSTQPVNFEIFYDDSPTVGFPFSIPSSGGRRMSIRQRLPAISFRIIRVVGQSVSDFQIWDESCLWIKFLCQGRGYEKALFVPN